MAVALGTLQTAQAARYVTQLCEHLAKLAGSGLHRDQGDHGSGGGPSPRSTERTSTGARLAFAWGACVLEVGTTQLAIHLTTEDEKSLVMAQRFLTQRIETFAHREGSAVVWS